MAQTTHTTTPNVMPMAIPALRPGLRPGDVVDGTELEAEGALRLFVAAYSRSVEGQSPTGGADILVIELDKA